MIVTRDPLGRDSTIDYDAHDLLPIQVADPVGSYDRGALQLPCSTTRLVTDRNGNTARVTFTSAGFVSASLISGQERRRRPDSRGHKSRIRPVRLRGTRHNRSQSARFGRSITIPKPTCRNRNETKRSRPSNTPTASGDCCKPARKPRMSCSAIRPSAAAGLSADHVSPGRYGRPPAPTGRSAERDRQRLAGLRQQGPGRGEVRAVLSP